MTSLSAHLRQPDAHGALPFHADCPMCRSERLMGSLAVGGPISARAQAALAASVLALSTTAPAALAAEPDSEHEGTAAVTQTGSTDPSQNPNFDPGGNSEALPAQAPTMPQNPAPATAGNDDSGPVEQQPATNTNDPVVDNGDGQDAGQPQTQPSPQEPPTQQPATVAADQTATDPSTADTSPPPPTPTDAGPSADPAATTTAPADSTTTADQPSTAGSAHSAPRTQRPRRRPSHLTARNVVHHRHTVSGGTVAAPPASPAAASAPTAVTTPAATTAAADDAKPGDRVHRVHAGESLWSIASDLLGPSASPARIAGEVHRLWQLNRERIATGNPDLLMVGTTLRLQ